MKSVAGTPDWLRTTVTTVRELMIQRIEKDSLDPESRREMEMALEELDVMWEELQGQAELLSRENERYAEFFEFAPDAYLVTDAGGKVREANQAASELFGAARDELVGRALGGCIPDEERATFLSRWVGLVVGEASGPASWSGRIRTAAGEVCEVQFSLRAIPLKKSGVGGICWLIRPLG
jgi:PAS domain S-box-containing protein